LRKLTRISSVKLLLVFAVAFSLASLPGPLASHFALPSISPARAVSQPCNFNFAAPKIGCTPYWYPAGPSEDTLRAIMFTDETSEFNALTLTKSIDLTDWPATAGLAANICGPTSLDFICTSKIITHDYYEIEFLLANNFWGCNMNFGSAVNTAGAPPTDCGAHIRQGISHLVDKVSFTNNQGAINKGFSVPIDSPLPSGSTFGGLTVVTPNPCGWDNLGLNPSGTSCVPGAAGGLAYHLAPATGVNFPWQPALNSQDFCAAAQHFISAFTAVGVTGVTRQTGTCILLAPGQTTIGVGWPTSVTGNTPNFFSRIDHQPRFELGNSLTQEICALFTGSFTTGCTPFLSYTPGTITSFCGFTTSTTGINPCWWMYTAGFNAVFPPDASVFFGYNSRFVSGGAWDKPPCSSAAVPSPSASNYEYLCNSSYDSESSATEFAADVSTSFTHATLALNLYGQGAYTIPIFSPISTFAMLSNWQRAVNVDGSGLEAAPNLSWLNAWSPNPAGCGTSNPNCLRVGFKQTTRSLSPYIQTTVWDFFIDLSVYDVVSQENPANTGQLLDWMTVNSVVLSNSQLSYIPPGCTTPTTCVAGGTTATFRYTLRSDLFFHDGRPVTAWDVKFSWSTLLANGAFIGSGLAPVVCLASGCVDGFDVLGPQQIDVHVSAKGPYTAFGVGISPVLPGRYWSGPCASTTWDNDVAAGNVPNSCMSTDIPKLSPTFDPLGAGMFIGSGPGVCKNPTTGIVGGGCTSTGVANPPPGGTYTLSRFGTSSPKAPQFSAYFRSSGTLAQYIWTQDTGDPVTDPTNFAHVAACFNQPVGTTGCTHWQKGIGASAIGVIGLDQTLTVQRFLFVNWVSPFNAATNPPDGMAPFPPVLYEGATTLNPCSIDTTNGYDC
jgi:hypothetical protein